MVKLFKQLGVFIVVVVLVLGFCKTDVFADCGMCGVDGEHVEEELSNIKTFQATAICLGCTLKKEQGAKALCSVFGHKNALRTEDGKIWTILENEASAELINLHEYAGEKIQIKGKKFADTQVVEVTSFKVLGEEAIQHSTAEHSHEEHPKVEHPHEEHPKVEHPHEEGGISH